MTGGHSADISYSSYFDNDVKHIYDAAKAGKQPASISPQPMKEPVLPGAGTWKYGAPPRRAVADRDAALPTGVSGSPP